MNKIHIIGAGGVGSWLTPAMCLLAGQKVGRKTAGNIVIIDGDTLEKKNLNRQLFDSKSIGENKATALSDKYGCDRIFKYYTHGMMELDETDWILCGVDNNPGRASVLESCDAYGCKAIFGANETFSAEAYYYEPGWKGSPSDPRVYYPEIATDLRFDPRGAAIGCTGEAQEQNPQLVSANYMAAALMQQLFILWKMQRPTFGAEAIPHVPYLLRQNMTKFETVKQANHQPKE